jgi:histone H1/5
VPFRIPAEYEDLNDSPQHDPRLHAIPDIHGHAKGEHKAFIDERPIPLSARMLFLWFYHACKRGWPRFLMVTDHMNYLTFEDPAAINLVRRALKLAQAGDLYGAAETASVEVGQAAIVSEGLRRGMRYSIGAEVDNDPRSRPDAQNIVDAMKPDGMIRSVHFLTIDHPAHGPNWNWPFDNPEFADVYDIVGTAKTWELYMATLLDAVERLPGNIVGHFYVPALFGHWPDDATLEGYEDALVDACEARGMAVEFNTRFLYRDHSEAEKAKYLDAHRRLLAKCKSKNVGIAVGSDAHSPKDQGGAFATVLALLDECEINELVFPLGGRLARVALRVERKVEPAEAPVLAAEERKAVRRARPSETSAHETLPAGPAALDPEPDAQRAKPRPKRSRVKAAEAMLVEPVAEPFAEPLAESFAEALAEQTGETIIAVVEPAREEAPPGSNGVAEADAAVDLVVAETEISDGITEMVTVPDIEPIVTETPAEPIAADGAVADDWSETPPLDDVDDPVAFVIDAVEIDPSPAVEFDPSEKVGSKTKTAARKGGSASAKPGTATKKAAKSGAKSAAKKAAAKQAAAAKKAAAAPKLAAKKAAAKQAAAKKASAKKAAARASLAKKAAAKKTAAKKTGAKKSSPKKTAPRRR